MKNIENIWVDMAVDETWKDYKELMMTYIAILNK